MRDYCATKMRRKWKPAPSSTRFFRFAVLQLLLFTAVAEAREMLQSSNASGDMAALLSFKKSSVQNDPHGFLSDWKSTSRGPCSWRGVSCSSDGRVSALDLAGGGLVGSLHLQDLTSLPELQTLNLRENSFSNGDLASPPSCSLQSIDLSSNNLTGTMGRNSFLGSCRRLAAVDLAGNNFSVSISSFDFGACSGLALLNLSAGGFSGDKFPSSLKNCHLLETLDTSHNDLQGAIPGTFFQNMTKIKRLNLSHNRFSGHIPPEIGTLCATIEDLDLSANNLDGGLPPSLGTCLSLWNLNLGNNQLSGDFLGTVVANLSSLRYLRTPFNNITGPVPLSLTRLSQLRVLDLSSNGFTGKISADFCGSTSVLEKLLLPDNYLVGPIPPLLGNCTFLKVIDFSFNSLTGEIPDSIWRLPNISDIVMWANNLTGEIPDGICKTGGKLESLILNNNLISGTIPNSIADCTNMVWVSLSGNRLTGGIPPVIGNLLNLAILQLGGNSLTGKIPPELGHCRSLIWLDLNSNNLSGTLPPELSEESGLIMPGSVAGKQFVFVRNEGGTACRGAGGLVEFEGIRASRLENFPMVHSCPSTRVYSGRTVYTFPRNGTMIYLDLSYNSLSGTIPKDYGSMKFLQVLNLGHNRLSGSIPGSFGGLRAIGVLDLSHNSLEGFVPGSLGSLNFLNDLDVSNNNLTGPIPSGGQLTTFPSARFENNSGLCGLPLPPCGSGSGPNHPADRYSAMKKQPFEAALILGITFFFTCIIAIMFALYRVKEGQEKGKKYVESVSGSGCSSWKVSSIHEPLSINVATFETPLKKLTFGHLVEATNRFSSETLIGSGGFGEVYKAKLRDGNTVAIKKLIYVAGQGDREFMAEMETIGKIKHRNLVPLLGYCKVGEERLLVYEYMKWGSLESVLHDGPKHSVTLDWPARKKIAIGSARGLAFLHHSCIPHIIHRDMKSSNVLLDEHFEARVSDFGMARLVNALDTHLSVSTLAGTPGYVPPEYYQSFRCTAKGDVYSFGVVLLELLSGKRPIDPNEFGDDNNLVGWAKQLERENRSGEILDSKLTEGKLSTESELYRYLGIAFECLDDRPFRRPTMIQVMTMFKELQVDSETDILDGLSVKDIVIEEESREKEP